VAARVTWLANHLGHRLIAALAGPLFLTVFCERQLVAENLHAAEIGFQRHEGRAIDLRAGHLERGQGWWGVPRARAIGQDGVKLQILLTAHLVGKDWANAT
jgi:hypothetical protein